MNEAGNAPRFVVRGLSGALQGRSWTVRPERPLIFGRTVTPAPDIVAVAIPDLRISSQHCRIERTPLEEGEAELFQIVDLDSRNGVRINGKKIPRGATEPLKDGDVVSLAEIALEIRIHTSPDSVVSSHSRVSSATKTVHAGGGGSAASPIIPELLPFPIAMGVRRVRHAIGSIDLVQEVLRSFETVLRFQTLVTLSEYLARGVRDAQVAALLEGFCQRPYTMGRWLELSLALARSLRDDTELVVEELAAPVREGENRRRWKSAAARIVELRNSLLHGEGISAGSADSVAPELSSLFDEIVSGLAFWMGYRFIAVEHGTWCDELGEFRYPCRLLLGCTTPFETRVLRTVSPLPPRVPIIIARDAKRRLSLAPLQTILPAEDKQLHWFWLSECHPNRTQLETYPAGFRTPIPNGDALQELLIGRRMPTKARADFDGKLPVR